MKGGFLTCLLQQLGGRGRTEVLRKRLIEELMGSIRIISTSTVCAAIHKESDLRIDLTPWDLGLLQMGTIQKGLIFCKPPKDIEFESTSLIHHLKTSLSRTLDYFPPLVGRLATIEHGDNTISFFINCNNAGAEFVHASANGVSIADIVEPVYVPDIVYSFFPLNGVKNCEGISKPLLSVQVTELVDGIFIASTMNHSAADGSSFWHFLNSWSEISRGFECISKLPVLQRWFPCEFDCPIHLPPWSTALHLPPWSTALSAQPSETGTPPPLQQRVFHITKANMAKLKAKANAEIGSSKISSLQALLSHIWRSSVRNKSLDLNEEVRFPLVIGVRPRLQPPLPPEYFGNAVQSEILSMKARDQLEQGVGYVALQMNNIIAMHTDKKIRNSWESWRANPKIVTWDSVPKNICFPSGSPRFNVYGNDFGWGKPIAVISGPANKADGKISLFSGVEEGSVDIEACFLPETMQGMGNDLEFIQFVS